MRRACGFCFADLTFSDNNAIIALAEAFGLKPEGRLYIKGGRSTSSHQILFEGRWCCEAKFLDKCPQTRDLRLRDPLDLEMYGHHSVLTARLQPERST